MTTTTDHRGTDGAEMFPTASPETLARIAARAQERAERAEAEGIDDGHAHSAEQPDYGCAWHWGDGIEIRDARGNLVIDDDDEPCARVYDCDGNTIEVIKDATRTTTKAGFYANDSDTVYVTPAGRVWLVASDDDLPTVRELGEMIEGASPVGEMLTPDEAVGYLRQVEAEGGESLVEGE